MIETSVEGSVEFLTAAIKEVKAHGVRGLVFLLQCPDGAALRFMSGEYEACLAIIKKAEVHIVSDMIRAEAIRPIIGGKSNEIH